MLKTPDEIKKGLECCIVREIDNRIISCHTQCTYGSEANWCRNVMHSDALAYIQQLESRLAQVERERDALMHDVSKCRRCETCAKRRIPIHKCPHFDGGTQYPCWEWRGVCPENSKEETK